MAQPSTASLRPDDRDRRVVRARELVAAPKTAEDYLRLAALTELVTQANIYSASKEFPALVKPFGVDVDAVLKAQAAPAPKTRPSK